MWALRPFAVIGDLFGAIGGKQSVRASLEPKDIKEAA